MCNGSCPDKLTEHSNLLKVLLFYDYNMDREGRLALSRAGNTEKLLHHSVNSIKTRDKYKQVGGVSLTSLALAILHLSLLHLFGLKYYCHVSTA